jgi:hypothetical protein
MRYLLVLQCVLEGLLLMSYSISFEAKLMIHGESSTCTEVGCQGESIDPSMEEVLHAHKWIAQEKV